MTIVKAVLKVLGIATTVFEGTDGVKKGAAGIVPMPTPEDTGKVLGADGKWVYSGDIGGQTTKFEEAKERKNIESGETVSTIFGKIKKWITDLNGKDNPKKIWGTDEDGNSGWMDKVYNSEKAETMSVPRHNEDDAIANLELPGNMFRVDEFAKTVEGLPTKEWYYVISVNGGDGHYAAQLALGMTTPAVYYRRKQGDYTEWRRLIDVSGTDNTVPIENGGTGKSTAGEAANMLMNALTLGNSDPVDGDYYISQWAGGGDSNITYTRRPMSKLWNYIKSKISTELPNPVLTYVNCASVSSSRNGTLMGYYAELNADYSGINGKIIMTSIILLGVDNSTPEGGSNLADNICLGSIVRDNAAKIVKIGVHTNDVRSIRCSIAVLYYKDN